MVKKGSFVPPWEVIREGGRSMEGLAQAITTLPPDAIDRQRLLECLGHAEKNRRRGKMREAAKWVMNVGAALHKKGGEAMPLAERTFQHSVHLAKQMDNDAPEYMKIELEGNNRELGDAYTWLGATESALGKTTEAETHYKAAARAVEERGIVEVGDKLLHQAIFFRSRKMRDKYDAVMKRWDAAIRAAATGECPEGDVALLHATVQMLQEKAGGLSHSGETDGPKRAAALRGGPLAAAVVRLEAHPLRAKPFVDPEDTYELAAQTYDKMRDKAMSHFYLRLALAATAATVRFAGLEPLGETMKGEGGDAAVAWTPDLLDHGWGRGKVGGEDAGAEDRGDTTKDGVVMTPVESAALEAVLSIGDRWKMRGARSGETETMEGADRVGNMAYVLGEQLFVAEMWKECQRPLRAAAALLTHLPFRQGEACHYLGCAYYHQNAKQHGGSDKRLLTFAAGAFQSAVAARLSVGMKNEKAVKKATGSLLFLGKVLTDLDNWADAERVHRQALEMARDVLGDSAQETQECIQAMMGLRGKVRAMQELANR